MKPDRPLILSVLLIAAGITLTVIDCTGNIGLSAGYPLSGASFKLNIMTYGPAALGGPALTALGLIVLLWALFCAVLRQFGLFGSESEREDDGPTRLFGSGFNREEGRARLLE